jgi:transcriptional regulator with XRE-family HTH domain
MNIGEMIHNRRIELQLTLEDIGNAVGVSKSTVKKWEDGFISNMRRDKIAKLAKILKINPVSLITGELVVLSNAKDFSISEHEQKVITAYRQQPSMQEAVDRLLGVEYIAKEKQA